MKHELAEKPDPDHPAVVKNSKECLGPKERCNPPLISQIQDNNGR